MAGYLSASDYLNRSDVALVSQLCARQTPNTSGPPTPAPQLTPTQLLTDPILAAALLDASSEVLAACTQGDRYTDGDLANLTGTTQAKLFSLVAQKTDCLLWERRQMGTSDIPPPVFYDRVEADLERLRQAQRFFAV